MLTLKDILPFIHNDCEIHIFFAENYGELIFNNKEDIDDFWKSFQVKPSSLEPLTTDTMSIVVYLPK